MSDFYFNVIYLKSTASLSYGVIEMKMKIEKKTLYEKL